MTTNQYSGGKMSKLAYFVEFRYWQDEALREGTEDPAWDHQDMLACAQALGAVPV